MFAHTDGLICICVESLKRTSHALVCASIPLLRAAQSAVSSSFHSERTLINNNSSSFRKEVEMKNIYADRECFRKRIFSIKKRIWNYYIDTIGGIEGDRDALEMELHRVRFIYNVLNGFASGFVVAFLSGLAGLLVGCANVVVSKGNFGLLVEIKEFIFWFFIAIILCQLLFLYLANTYYEKMKVVEEELEEIKNS